MKKNNRLYRGIPPTEIPEDAKLPEVAPVVAPETAPAAATAEEPAAQKPEEATA